MAISILYISYDGMTDALGQSQVIPYLIGLTKKGYSFVLISCEKEENFKQNQQKIQSILTQNNIVWKPISYTKKPPVFSTVYDVFRIKKLAFQLQHKYHFSIVHCRSYIAALVGMQMKNKFNIKFVFDMRGLWADERVDGKLWNLRNPLYKAVYTFFKKKEMKFLTVADSTISLTENAKSEILSWKNINKNKTKITVIPCCVDLELFNKNKLQINKIQLLKNELKISNQDFILLYLGSIGTWYMLDEMMEFFSFLKKEKPTAKFLFVTKDEYTRIMQTAEKYNVQQDIIIRAGAREEIPYLISLANYSIFFILPSYSKKASSPTKQGEIMAMGIPIICNTNVGDTDKIVLEYNSGILLNNFTEGDYKNAVTQMENNIDETAIINGANEYFSLENGIEKYDAIYKTVLD